MNLMQFILSLSSGSSHTGGSDGDTDFTWGSEAHHMGDLDRLMGDI